MSEQTAGATMERLFESRVVTVKELTQLANRGRFHMEKAVFAMVVAGVFVVGALSELADAVDIGRMAAFGRSAFFSVSITACVMLSAFSLISATGIIMAEATGKRLDILRITPLSLRTIVLGKGVAIIVKSLLVLVLLTPVLAAAQLYGGVEVSDVVKAVIIIFANVLLCTCLGLRVSAGATSNLDRVVRSLEWLVVLLFVSGMVSAVLVFITRAFSASVAASYLLAFSPFGVWAVLMQARLGWGPVAFNLGLSGAVAFLFAAGAVRALRKEVRKSQEQRPEPKLKNLLAGFRGLSLRRRRKKTAYVQRDWVGTLVGGQVVQTSMLPILLPLVIAVPPMLVGALDALFGRGGYMDAEMVFNVSVVLSLAIAVMVALQAAAIIAREKERHTAEVLATTPAGAANMLWWKGGAVAVSQSAGILLCLLLLASPDSAKGFDLSYSATRVVSLLALYLLAWSTGLAFSVVAATPLAAAAWVGIAVFLLAPLVNRLMPGYATVAAFLCGVVLVFFRQRFPLGRTVLLAAGLALILGAGPDLLDMGRYTRSHLELMAAPFQDAWQLNLAAALKVAFLEIALSALIIAGVYQRFTRSFLSGARAGK